MYRPRRSRLVLLLAIIIISTAGERRTWDGANADLLRHIVPVLACRDGIEMLTQANIAVLVRYLEDWKTER